MKEVFNLSIYYITGFQFDWCIWPPSQYINFTWVPQAYRVLYVNVVTVIWDIFLSKIKHYVSSALNFVFITKCKLTYLTLFGLICGLTVRS